MDYEDNAQYYLIWAVLMKRAGGTVNESLVRKACESISTVDGRPHGHILYSWNSGYWWRRKEIRRPLGQPGEDPVERAVDARLGVVREHGQLRLDPSSSAGKP